MKPEQHSLHEPAVDGAQHRMFDGSLPERAMLGDNAELGQFALGVGHEAM